MDPRDIENPIAERDFRIQMNLFCRLGFHKFKLIKKDAIVVYEDVKQNKPLKEIVTATADVYDCMRCLLRDYRHVGNIKTIQVKK